MNNKGMTVTIAAVMLVGITVALTLAVAYWVGSLSFRWMETESLVITDVFYHGISGDSDNQIVARIQNSGAEAVTLLKARVSGHDVDKIIDFSDITIDGGENYSLTLGNVGWHSGYQYRVEVLSSRGNTFQAKAPS
jgi:hypothetical protein